MANHPCLPPRKGINIPVSSVPFPQLDPDLRSYVSPENSLPLSHRSKWELLIHFGLLVLTRISIATSFREMHSRKSSIAKYRRVAYIPSCEHLHISIITFPSKASNRSPRPSKFQRPFNASHAIWGPCPVSQMSLPACLAHLEHYSDVVSRHHRHPCHPFEAHVSSNFGIKGANHSAPMECME